MMDRFRRYRDNLGILNAVLGVLFAAYITWSLLQLSSVLMMLVYAAFAFFLLILPCALMPMLVARPAIAVRIIKLSQYGIYGIFVLSILNVLSIPPIAGFALIAYVFFHIGFVFWFYSDPNIMTEDGHQRWVERAEHAEKEVLIEAMMRDQQLLDEDQV
ncbi:MAG: hypothetical protein JJ974_12430 [Phycisphaerales bacterium]|nr:hypothetical protein [Phycisphaerales bacterium]